VWQQCERSLIGESLECSAGLRALDTDARSHRALAVIDHLRLDAGSFGVPVGYDDERGEALCRAIPGYELEARGRTVVRR
jgi:hypothetical protein